MSDLYDAPALALKQLPGLGVQPFGLTDIPRDMLEAIVTHASPPTVYRLCLTSKAFHAVDAQSTSTLGKVCRLSTRLLQLALKASLGRVLCRKGTSLAAFDYQLLRSNDGPGALLTGSTVALASLGCERYPAINKNDWHRDTDNNEDIDIVCTPAHAAAVRSMLVTKGGFALGGLHYVGGMCDFGEIEVEQLVRCDINHVELWFHCTPEELNEKYIDRSSSLIEYIDHNCGALAGNHWEGMETHRGRETFDAHHRIEGLAGTAALPFKHSESTRIYNTDTTQIDVIVGSDHKSQDAREMLKIFDLSICKSWWDGNFFHVCQPHLTFQSQAVLEPQRRRLMQRYQELYEETIHSEEYDDVLEQGICQSRQNDLWQFFPNRAEAQAVFDANDEGLFGENGILEYIHIYDWQEWGMEEDDQDHASDHCKLMRHMFQRLQKFRRRGVEVLNTLERLDFLEKSDHDDFSLFRQQYEPKIDRLFRLRIQTEFVNAGQALVLRKQIVELFVKTCETQLKLIRDMKGMGLDSNDPAMARALFLSDHVLCQAKIFHDHGLSLFDAFLSSDAANELTDTLAELQLSAN